MNNEQFRSLYKEQTDSSKDGSSRPARTVLGGRRGGHRGSSNASTSFAQSARERSAFLQPEKKHKSKEPKAIRLGAGYVDRAKERANAESEDQDERTKQIDELEQQLKRKEISRAHFEAARDAITGGDISATHLVKGLDRQLLERIRQGEDVLGTSSSTPKNDALDDELDKLESTETAQVQKEKIVKQGELASTAIAGRKRTRDDIMAEIKAQRKAAADAQAAAEPQLSDKWAAITQKQRTRIETDRKGREVLVILDENGAVKKKLRRPAPAQPATEKEPVRAPTEVLGADVQVDSVSESAPAAKQDDSEDDIFEGVGTEYDPLGDDGSSAASDSDEEQRPRTTTDHDRPSQPATHGPASLKPRNYFNDKSTLQEESADNRFGGVQAVIAKAAKLASAKDEHGSEEDDPETARRKAKYAAMLDTRDRDLDDMDLGFGASRFEDGEDDGTGKGVRLSEWSTDKLKSEAKPNKHKKREKRDK